MYIPSAKVHFQSTKVCFQFAKVHFQSTKVYFQSKRWKYKSILSKYNSILSKYKSILSKYKSILSKYEVTFGTLGTESPESGTFLIPLVPGTRFPDPGTIGTGSWNLGTYPRVYPNLGTHLEPVPGTLERRSPGTYPNLGTRSWNLEPNQFPERFRFLEPPALELILTLNGFLEPRALGTYPNLGILEPVPGTSSLTGSRYGSRNFPPELSRNRFFPEPPQLAQHTPKSILGRDPIAFCCWGKNQSLDCFFQVQLRLKIETSIDFFQYRIFREMSENR